MNVSSKWCVSTTKWSRRIASWNSGQYLHSQMSFVDFIMLDFGIFNFVTKHFRVTLCNFI
jgi:hypothetical protein